jgi:hypothetical protein
MSDDVAIFKAQLIAIIAEFSFSDDKNTNLGRSVYNCVNEAFEEYEVENKKSSEVSLLPWATDFTSKTVKNEEKPKRATNQNTLKAQVSMQIDDVGDFIKNNKFKNKKGRTCTDWNIVAIMCYNTLNIKMADGAKPTGDNIQHAYYGAMRDRNKSEQA